ncbi:hypothetical protein QUF70_16940, partial [Desulfobacterales bacterium HSG17]|nr:hypothetical protein [Desulfobacterales bacterium HSG17]
FQNTRLPHLDFSITGFYQQAVESPRCPHFVTGSAMSILADEIIGKGALYGRFRYRQIKGFTDYWGRELCVRAAKYYGAEIPELMAPVISERCGGNPFYITALVQQAKEQNQPVNSEKILNKMLAVDISSGFIWAELNDQVNSWIRRINEYGITKWILYLAAIEEDDKISLERIQIELKRHENIDVSIQKIKEIMVKLARGDLIEYKSFGDWFGKINDPILNEFLKIWGKVEVEGLNSYDVNDDLRKKYGKFKRRINEYKGYLAEIHMSQILLNAQRMTLDSFYFNTDKPVNIPDFTFVHHRYRISSGKGREIDIMGAAGEEQWVCQSKWLKGDKISIGVLRDLKKQGDMVVREKEPEILRMWLFAHDGLTRPALEYAIKHGILWSSRKELDKLLEHVGLRRLPELDVESGWSG